MPKPGMFVVMRCAQCNEHWAVPAKAANQTDVLDEKKAFADLVSSGGAKCPKCGSTQVSPVYF